MKAKSLRAKRSELETRLAEWDRMTAKGCSTEDMQRAITAKKSLQMDIQIINWHLKALGA